MLPHTQPSHTTTTTKTSLSPPTAKTLTPASPVLTAVLKQAFGLDDVTGIKRTVRLFTMIQKVSGKSSWKVHGTRLFGSFQRELSGSNGTSEKAVLLFRTECAKRKFVFHFFTTILNSSLRPCRPFLNGTDL